MESTQNNVEQYHPLPEALLSMPIPLETIAGFREKLVTREDEASDYQVLGAKSESESERSGTFSIPASIGPKTNAVIEIEKACQEGRPIHLYEFAQGMVDYGLDDPKLPPRIKLHVQKGGSTEVIEWDGTRDFLEFKDDIVRVEFYNSGPGLAPENIVVMEHTGGEDTYGQHGVGTTNALAYLASRNEDVTIESNYIKKSGSRRYWSAKTSLEETESGLTEVLAMKGEWGDELAEDDELNTRIIIDSPSEEFLEDLANLSTIFLHANPYYHDACIVPRHPDAETPLESWRYTWKDEEVEDGGGEGAEKSGTIECLSPDFSTGEPPYSTIFVDGLELEMRYSGSTIFQWSVKGLSRADYYVRRSSDSTRLHADSFHSLMIEKIIFKCENPEIIKKIIQFAYEHSDERFLELPAPYQSKEMPDEHGVIVKKEWGKIHPNTIITSNEILANEHRKKYEDEQEKIEIVSIDLYHYLKNSGVPTLEDELSAKLLSRAADLPAMALPEFEDDKARMTYFIRKLAEQCPELNEGDVTTLEVGGKPTLLIGFPALLLEPIDFAGQSRYGSYQYGPFIRMAFDLIDDSEGFSIDAWTLIPANDEFFQISVKSIRGQHYREHCVEVNRSTPAATEIMDLRRGTYLMLMGPDDFDLNRLKSIFSQLKAYQERMIKSFNLKKLPKVVLEQVSRQPIGISDPDSKAFEDHPKNSLNPGFHPTNIASEFVVEDGVGSWKENSALTEYPYSVNPPHSWQYNNRACLTQLNGSMKLPVEEGERVVAVVGSERSDIKLCRDVNTGTFLVRGQAEYFWYYTGPDDGFDVQNYSQQLPTEDDLNCSIDLESLNPEVRRVLIAAQALETDSEKLDFLLKYWLTHFSYDSSPELDDLKKGKTEAQVITQIIGAMCGQCNYAGTGFVQALRFLGIPTKGMMGCNVDKKGKWGGPHMKVKPYIDGRWRTVDPTPPSYRALRKARLALFGKFAGGIALAGLLANAFVDQSKTRQIDPSALQDCEVDEEDREQIWAAYEEEQTALAEVKQQEKRAEFASTPYGKVDTIMKELAEHKIDINSASQQVLELLPSLSFSEIEKLNKTFSPYIALEAIPNETFHSAFLQKYIEEISAQNVDENNEGKKMIYERLDHLSKFCRYGVGAKIRKQAEKEAKKQWEKSVAMGWNVEEPPLYYFLTSPDIDLEFVNKLIEDNFSYSLFRFLTPDEFFDIPSETTQLAVLENYKKMAKKYLFSQDLTEEEWEDLMYFADSILERSELQRMETQSTHEPVSDLLSQLASDSERYRKGAQNAREIIIRKVIQSGRSLNDIGYPINPNDVASAVAGH